MLTLVNKVLRLPLLLLSLSLLLPSCGHQQSLPDGAVVVETLSGGSNQGNVFILLPEEKFTKEAIENIVAVYRPQCSPPGLDVIIFSDPDLLAKRIAFEKSEDVRDFANDETGRKAANAWVQKTRWPAGTFVAGYHRFLNNEHYWYRLSKNTVKPTTVIFDPAVDPNHCELEGNRRAD